jgi:hypothetical protein
MLEAQLLDSVLLFLQDEIPKHTDIDSEELSQYILSILNNSQDYNNIRQPLNTALIEFIDAKAANSLIENLLSYIELERSGIDNADMSLLNDEQFTQIAKSEEEAAPEESSTMDNNENEENLEEEPDDDDRNFKRRRGDAESNVDYDEKRALYGGEARKTALNTQDDEESNEQQSHKRARTNEQNNFAVDNSRQRYDRGSNRGGRGGARYNNDRRTGPSEMKSVTMANGDTVQVPVPASSTASSAWPPNASNFPNPMLNPLAMQQMQQQYQAAMYQQMQLYQQQLAAQQQQQAHIQQQGSTVNPNALQTSGRGRGNYSNRGRGGRISLQNTQNSAENQPQEGNQANNDMNSAETSSFSAPPRKFLSKPAQTTLKDSLFLTNIPSELHNMSALSSYFAKFGEIRSIKLSGGDKAIVSFNSPAEAEAAFNSPAAVCDNRFIRVKWLRDEIGEISGEQAEKKEKKKSALEVAEELKAKLKNSSASSNPAEDKNEEGGDQPLDSIISNSNAAANASELLAKLQEKRLALQQKQFEQHRDILAKYSNSAEKEEKSALLQQMKSLTALIEQSTGFLRPKSAAEAAKKMLENKLTALTAQLGSETSQENQTSVAAQQQIEEVKGKIAAYEAEATVSAAKAVANAIENGTILSSKDIQNGGSGGNMNNAAAAGPVRGGYRGRGRGRGRGY